MKDYGIVARKYGKSHRVLDKAMYMGNIPKEDGARFVVGTLNYYIKY